MDQQCMSRKRSYRLPLPPHKIAARQAHRILEWALEDWSISGAGAENIKLVMSELVTNALAHSLDVFRLSLKLDGGHVLVEVWDGNDDVPQVGLPDDLSVNGRGMYLVEALSKEWGVTHEEDGGKTVWAWCAT